MSDETTQTYPRAQFRTKVAEWTVGTVLSDMEYTPSPIAQKAILKAIADDLRNEVAQPVTIDVDLMCRVSVISE